MTDPQHMITGTSPPQIPLTSGDPPSPISLLPDDLLLLKIHSLLLSAADPRLLPRLSSVSRRLRRLLSSPLPFSLPLPPPLPPFLSLPYSTLHKLTVCCPGLLHAGVLISHFSWDRDFSDPPANSAASTVTSTPTESLFDNLSETLNNAAHDTDSANLTPSETETVPADANTGDSDCSSPNQPQNFTDTSSHKMRMKPFWREKSMGPTGSHLASGKWSLSRKQGIYLLASEFCNDSLYICDWPGCVHRDENRNYMLFRGVFEDFKKSRVWKKIMDSKWEKITLDCVYCACNEMWDLHLVGCLADNFMKFHGDGEPFVRAFVCENGHVSGEWTGRLSQWLKNRYMQQAPGRDYYFNGFIG